MLTQSPPNKIYRSPNERKRLPAKEDEELISLGVICPYYQRDRGNGRIYCECAHFRFPDREARREILYGFCAHPTNYKSCPLKVAMDHFYERKYEQIEKQSTVEAN